MVLLVRDTVVGFVCNTRQLKVQSGPTGNEQSTAICGQLDDIAGNITALSPRDTD